MLFAGTENALYVSFDDGGRWEPLQTKLPHAPVYWLTVQERFHDLVVGTYGRGIYILDDLTPLEQLTDAVRAEAAHLFTPRPAYRFRGSRNRAWRRAGRRWERTRRTAPPSTTGSRPRSRRHLPAKKRRQA